MKSNKIKVFLSNLCIITSRNLAIKSKECALTRMPRMSAAEATGVEGLKGMVQQTCFVKDYDHYYLLYTYKNTH